MQYMILIVDNENESSSATPADREKMFVAYDTYTKELQKAGVMLAGDPLLPTARGARIKVRDGKRTVKDGPFTEAKEVVGGYYLIQVKSKEEAVEWAARCPGAHGGEIELREVMEFPKK